MTTPRDPNTNEHSDLANEHSRRPILLWLLVLIVAAEAVMLAVGGVYSLILLPTVSPAEASTGIALIVVAFVFAGGLALMAFGLVRCRRWARSGAVTWQVLQGVVAIGCFQGLFANPEFGWALLAPAIVGFVIAVSPAVSRAVRD